MSPKLATNLINRVIVTVRHEMTISVSKTVTTNSAMDSAAAVVIIINVIIKDNVNRDDRLVMGGVGNKLQQNQRYLIFGYEF